jgi:sulfide dehydrogenase cytochrome subunit
MNIITLPASGSINARTSRRFHVAGLLAAAAGAGALLIAASPGPVSPSGRLLASQCFQCHGTDGQAVSGFESIAGKSANGMYESLLEMSLRRPENIMDMQARAFTPAQLRQIANYLSTLPGGD